MSRPWMPLYIADYLADTAHLNAAESGAYLHLIMAYWQKGPLPQGDRQLATIAKMLPNEWAEAKPVLAEFFGPGWTHARIDAELAKSNVAYERRAAAGRKRHERSDGSDEPAKQEQCSSNADARLNQPQPQPLSSETSSEERTADDAHAHALEIRPNDIGSLAASLFAAGGDALNRTCAGLDGVGTPLGWLASGADLHLDVLPTVKRICARASPDSIRSWSYFSQAVSDSLASRTKPLSKGTPRHDSAKPDRITEAFDRLDERLRQAREGDRGGIGDDRPEPPELSLVAVR